LRAGLAVTAGGYATVVWAGTTVRTGASFPASALSVPAGLTFSQLSGADPGGRHVVGAAQDASGQLDAVTIAPGPRHLSASLGNRPSRIRPGRPVGIGHSTLGPDLRTASGSFC
jgi:hypothetical protein